MHCSSISPYVSHVSVFNLYGCADSGETGGVPCRVRVGPRRFLDVTVFPQHFKCDIWARKDGKAVYLPGQEIPEQRDKHGTLFFDVLPYLRQRLGWECTCTVDEYNWAQRRRLWSDTFLSTEYGVAAAYSSWQDITVYHSSLHLAPGALTVCGHDVQAISWGSFDRKSGARSEVLGLMLKLMQADSQDTLDVQLSKMHLLELVTDAEEV